MSASSPVCGTGASRICTLGARSARCSTTCRCTRSCQPATSGRGAGRPPDGLLLEQAEELRLERGFSRISAANCVSFPPSPALAIFRPIWAVWCFTSARAISTVIRSCRSHEPSRRCRCPIAAACSSLPRNDHVKSITKRKVTQKLGQRLRVVECWCWCFLTRAVKSQHAYIHAMLKFFGTAQGALDNQQLLAIEGSKKDAASGDSTPKRSPKNDVKTPNYPITQHATTS